MLSVLDGVLVLALSFGGALGAIAITVRFALRIAPSVIEASITSYFESFLAQINEKPEYREAIGKALEPMLLNLAKRVGGELAKDIPKMPEAQSAGIGMIGGFLPKKYQWIAGIAQLFMGGNPLAALGNGEGDNAKSPFG